MSSACFKLVNLIASSIALLTLSLSPQYNPLLSPSYLVNFGYCPLLMNKSSGLLYLAMGNVIQSARSPPPILPQASHLASSISILSSKSNICTLLYNGFEIASARPSTTGLKPCAHQALLHWNINCSSASRTSSTRFGSGS